MLNKRLQAINAMIKAIGEPPLLDESDFSLSYEAQQAEKQLDFTRIEILSEGFKFNTLNTTWIPDSQGFIAVPPNVLTSEFIDPKYTIVDGMVFDRSEFNNKFEEGVEVEAVYDEDFEYIPTVIQLLIVARATYIYQRDVINDAGVNQSLKEEMARARTKVNSYKIKQTRANGRDNRFNRNSNPVGLQ